MKGLKGGIKDTQVECTAPLITVVSVSWRAECRIEFAT